jgi:hypothetical protein
MRISHAVIAAFTAALVVPFSSPAQAASAVRITYVQYDSPGDDIGTNGSVNAEWVRIKNVSGSKKSLTGWTLRDPAGHVYRFGTYTLGAGKTVTVHTGRGSSTAAHRYWGEDYYVWNNTGDKAILKNKSGTVVDSCTWGDGAGSLAC